MMLCKVALKNIRKSIKDYTIYFFTLILGVAIFYVFNAIESQTIMLKVSESTHQIIELMTGLLSGVSVFVSFILGFLIIYASRFLIKRRKKEFGIYLTLGMSKGKVSKLLLMETVFIGFLSLIVGLFLGIFLSQWMSIIVARMFEADMTEFAFTFSKTAMIKTGLYFGIIYLFVMFFNTFSISRCKLIDLLQASKKSERVRIKNPIVSILVFILATGILSYCYYQVTSKALDQTEETLLKIIALGIISTFLLFWSLSGLLLKIVMSIKSLYRKNLNTFILRQFDHKINTTVFSMSIICLMLFLTIGILSSAISVKNSMTHNLKTLAPVDIELYKTMNRTDSHLSEAQKADSLLKVSETLEKVDFDIQENFQDVIEFYTYTIDGLNLEKTLGSTFEEVKKTYPFLMTDQNEILIRLEDYNQLATLFHMPKYSLKENEYIIIADFDSMVDIRNQALKEYTPLIIGERIYYPKYDECQNGFIEMSSNHINSGVIILPDSTLNESMRSASHLFANYKGTTEKEKEAVEEKVLAIEDHEEASNITLNAITKIAIYEASIGLSALITFIGVYLGIIFLISSAAILALKELSESSDNKEKYQILRRLGVDEKKIHQTLFLQIFIFFMFPLVIAIIHSIFGLQFANILLLTFGNEHLLLSILLTAGILLFIYGGYFLITYFCSKNIIKE